MLDPNFVFWDWMRMSQLKHLKISGSLWEGVRLKNSANKYKHLKNCLCCNQVFGHHSVFWESLFKKSEHTENCPGINQVFGHHSVFWESVSLRQQSPVLLLWSDSASEYSSEKHYILWYKLKWVPFALPPQLIWQRLWHRFISCFFRFSHVCLVEEWC